MKILQVHNRYQQLGGEDTVVQMEAGLLQAYGHEVYQYSVNNDAIKGSFQKVKTALMVHYSKKSKEDLQQKLQLFQPDIVHVHNFFPLLTPSIYDACIEEGVPVVQTLHNFRTICPGALLMRAGLACEKCIVGSPYKSILHGCYQKSIIGTLAVARMVDYHRKQGTWETNVNQFIALSEFSKSKFIEAGFPSEKIIVKSNFYKVASEGISLYPRQGALFVGRLSEEKGVSVLIQAWSGLQVPLCIVGDGPLLNEIELSTSDVIRFLGRRSSEDVSKEMAKACFLVLPSICYENFPMTIAEAFAHSLPVICSKLGAMAEIVEHGVTGLHFEAGNPQDLAEKVDWAVNHQEEMKKMGENAKDVYEKKYTAEANYTQLMSIYQAASVKI